MRNSSRGKGVGNERKVDLMMSGDVRNELRNLYMKIKKTQSVDYGTENENLGVEVKRKKPPMLVNVDLNIRNFVVVGSKTARQTEKKRSFSIIKLVKGSNSGSE